MSDATLQRRVRGPAGTQRFVATLAAILLVTVLFLILDLFLAGVDRRESGAHAEAEYGAGVKLLAAGHAQDAEAHIGAAVAIDRQSVRYGLALGEAMLAEGRTIDAESTLKPLLDRAENDGAVNLAMAHVMLREARPGDATAYFHRAVFGSWGADSIARRTETRFELINLLARTGAAKELLAELLPLEEMSPDSLALQRRLGHLFILAGSPTRAATIFRALLRRDARDADAYAGMGEASLVLGNVRVAYADLAEAVRLEPQDTMAARELTIADSVQALDPTASAIGPRERYLRSRSLLTRTVRVLGSCAYSAEPALSDSARALLSIVAKTGREQSLGVAMVSTAGELWAAESGSCASASNDTVLRLLHGHLAAM